MWKWKIFWHVIYDINLLILNDGIYNICFCVIQKEKKQIFFQFIENKLAYFYGTNRDYWEIVKCVILFVEKSQKSQKNFEKNEKNEKRNRFCNSEREKKRELEEREKEKMQNKKSKRSDVLFLWNLWKKNQREEKGLFETSCKNQQSASKRTENYFEYVKVLSGNVSMFIGWKCR